MKLKISHTTSYKYDQPVSYALQQVRLTPMNNPQQSVINWSIEIEGGSQELAFSDQHKNHTLLVKANAGQTELHFTAFGEVETHDSTGVLGKVHGVAPLWHFKQPTQRTEAGKNVKMLSKAIGRGSSLLGDMHTLSKTILEVVPYQTSQTFFGTTAEEALKAGAGVCQDHAQIFVSAARSAGIPARYVSGYLMMNDRIDQEASHAWAEAYLDDLGWVGFDVSNGISPDERYVRLATGLDSRDAAPITGVRLGSARESMIVSLQIQQ